MKNIKNLVFSLCNATSIGSINEASSIAYKELSKYCSATLQGNTVVGEIKGESEYKILLDAHVDQIGFIVTDIDDKGFLTLSKCGGIDLRTLPATTLTVYGKERIKAVFCSTPPHLSSEAEEFKDIANFKVDTLLGERAKEVVSLGDYAVLDGEPIELLGDRITAPSLDDRVGVACLLELARRLEGKKLPVSVGFLFSDMEELGTRGAKTASFKIEPEESIAIDVSFAAALDVSKEKAGELSGGAMIGVAPTLDRNISKALINIAEENEIPYQQEVMGGRTGTNADVISISKCGVKTGLLSIPLRNMHTKAEIVDMKDILSLCDILEKYILSGGLFRW